MSEAAKNPPTRSRRRQAARVCPICGRPRDPRYEPFCSRRCADVDLIAG